MSARRPSLAVALLATLAGASASASADEPPARESDQLKSDSAQAAAALQATQDLEAKLIQIRRELDGLEKQRASWDDVRRRLDELDARLAALSQQLAAARVATAEPFQEAESGSRGIVLGSADGSVTMRVSVRLQGGYEGAWVDRTPGELASRDVSGFLLRHADVTLQGASDLRFAYRLEIDLNQATGATLRDAFLRWRMFSALALRVGRFKVPFSLQHQYWSGHYEMVDLSAVTAEWNLDRDVGVMLEGQPLAGRLQYQIAATNGVASGANDNLDLAYVARAVAAPLGPLPAWEGDPENHRRPLISVGGAGYFNLAAVSPARDLDGNGRVDNVAIWQAAAEIRALWRGAALQAEYFRRWEQLGASMPDRRFWGGYIQASYFVLPGVLQIAARIGHADRPLFGIAEDVRLTLGRTIEEQSGALSYYVRGHDLKIQVDYSRLVVEDAIAGMIAYSPHTHRVRGAVQLAF